MSLLDADEVRIILGTLLSVIRPTMKVISFGLFLVETVVRVFIRWQTGRDSLWRP